MKAKNETTATRKKSSTSSKTSSAKSTSAASNGKATPAEAKGRKTPAKADAAKDLQELFVDGLKDMYWAEKALKKELPKMIKNATSEKLKEGMTKHMEETMEHIARLESCFEEIGEKAKAEKCDAMEGLLEEGQGIIKETKAGAVRDAGIIAAAQKVEHYEIASYGTLAAFAKVLGHKKSLKHLLKTLEEEKKCDELLTSIADTALNTKAM
jgi:ferritin-like metal-binding protein YciE